MTNESRCKTGTGDKIQINKHEKIFWSFGLLRVIVLFIRNYVVYVGVLVIFLLVI